MSQHREKEGANGYANIFGGAVRIDATGPHLETFVAVYAPGLALVE